MAEPTAAELADELERFHRRYAKNRPAKWGVVILQAAERLRCHEAQLEEMRTKRAEAWRKGFDLGRLHGDEIGRVKNGVPDG